MLLPVPNLYTIHAPGLGRCHGIIGSRDDIDHKIAERRCERTGHPNEKAIQVVLDLVFNGSEVKAYDIYASNDLSGLNTYCNHCGAHLQVEGHLPDCAELPDQDAIEAREEEAGGSNNVCRVTVSSVVWHVNCAACGQSYDDSNKDRPVICGHCGMSLDQPEARPYEVINLKTDQSHGRFATLDEAKGCVAYDHLDAHFAIWHDSQGRVCWCDEYEGDDDRVKQGLGQPNASEGNDNMDRIDRMADDYASEQR